MNNHFRATYRLLIVIHHPSPLTLIWYMTRICVLNSAKKRVYFQDFAGQRFHGNRGIFRTKTSRFVRKGCSTTPEVYPRDLSIVSIQRFWIRGSTPRSTCVFLGTYLHNVGHSKPMKWKIWTCDNNSIYIC